MSAHATDPALKDEEGHDLDSSMEGAGPEDEIMMVEPVPAYEWIHRLGPDTHIWLVKEKCFAQVTAPIVPSPNSARMWLVPLRWNSDPTVRWEMDLDGCGYDGSQLLQPVFGWEANQTLGVMEGHDPIEFLNNVYQVMAWLVEELTDKPFPGFQHGLPEPMRTAMITRPVRLAEAMGTRSLPTKADVEAGADAVIMGARHIDRMPQFVQAYRSRTPLPASAKLRTPSSTQNQQVKLPPTPAANMAEHPEIAVPHEVPVTASQVAESKKKAIPSDGDDADGYRVTE
jgi:hypothetical protein